MILPRTAPAAVELQTKQKKEELLGKITEHYTLRKKNIPMGLNLLSVRPAALPSHARCFPESV